MLIFSIICAITSLAALVSVLRLRRNHNSAINALENQHRLDLDKHFMAGWDKGYEAGLERGAAGERLARILKNKQTPQ